jgi:hypothetical protein
MPTPVRARLKAIRVTAIIVGIGLLFGQSLSAPVAAGHRPEIKKFKHVFVVMMENTGYDALIGNPNAPFINQAAHRFGVARNYFGVTHPSQPNYVAMTAGQIGNDSDDDETLDVPNLVDQLEMAGRSWTDYQQSFSLCAGDVLAHACGNQLYERKHNPFVSFADVQSSPARLSHVVDLTQLDADLARGGHASDFSFIAPDQCHDMHGRGGGGAADPCDFSNVQLLIKAGDTFLRDLVGKITYSRAFKGNSVIFIAWDESDFTGSPTDFGFGDTRGCCDANPGGGHVLALVISNHDRDSDHGRNAGRGARASDRAYNHYSLLKTIQDSWHLGCLGFTCDTANVKAMSDLVRSK